MNHGNGSGHGYGNGYPHGPQGYAPAAYFNQYAARPVEHPSAQSALVLGILGALMFGALLGVPAIFMGRKVERDLRNSSQWRPTSNGKIAIGLGWLSVFETAFVVALAMTHGIAAGLVGLVVAVCGLLALAAGRLGGVSGALARAIAPIASRPLVFGLMFGGLLLGSVINVPRAFAEREAARRACESARGEVAKTQASGTLAEATSAVAKIKSACALTDAESSSFDRYLTTREAAERKQKEEQAAAEAARVAAEKEAIAVATFPARSKELVARIKGAPAKAWQGKADLAAEDLDSVKSDLDGFQGTSVASSKEYAAVVTQLEEKRKTIQPLVDRLLEKRQKEAAALAEKRAREEAAAALKAAILGPKPVNSAWDGSVSAVERYLKVAMHDPDSYEHVRTTEPVIEGDYWVVKSMFRGKNMFGGKVVNAQKFYIQQGSVVKVTDLGGDSD